MHYKIQDLLSVCLACGWLSACLPAQLDKYRNQEHNKLRPTAAAESGDPAGRMASPPPVAAVQPSPETPSPAPTRASIYAIDSQTYRFALGEREVWDAALTVLMRNYNPTIVDRGSGIISTEWDSYFLNGAAYRNKISMRLVRSGMTGADLSIHNNVERLRDASQASASVASVGAVWLRSADPANEVARILQNMAILLGQPPPVLPPNGAMVRAGDLDSSTLTR